MNSNSFVCLGCGLVFEVKARVDHVCYCILCGTPQPKVDAAAEVECSNCRTMVKWSERATCKGEREGEVCAEPLCRECADAGCVQCFTFLLDAGVCGRDPS
jgi:hypothetical protein